MTRISGKIARIWLLRSQKHALTLRWGSGKYPLNKLVLHITYSLFIKSGDGWLQEYPFIIKKRLNASNRLPAQILYIPRSYNFLNEMDLN